MNIGKAKVKTYADGTLSIIRRLLGGGLAEVGVRGYGRLIVYYPNMDLNNDTDWVFSLLVVYQHQHLWTI